MFEWLFGKKDADGSGPKEVTTHNERCAQIITSRVASRLFDLLETFPNVKRDLKAAGWHPDGGYHIFGVSVEAIKILQECVDAASKWLLQGGGAADVRFPDAPYYSLTNDW